MHYQTKCIDTLGIDMIHIHKIYTYIYSHAQSDVYKTGWFPTHHSPTSQCRHTLMTHQGHIWAASLQSGGMLLVHRTQVIPHSTKDSAGISSSYCPNPLKMFTNSLFLTCQGGHTYEWNGRGTVCIFSTVMRPPNVTFIYCICTVMNVWIHKALQKMQNVPGLLDLSVTMLDINEKMMVIQFAFKSFYLHAPLEAEIVWFEVMCCIMMQCSECWVGEKGTCLDVGWAACSFPESFSRALMASCIA